MSKQYFNDRAGIWDEKVAEKDTAKLKAMAARLKIETGATVLDAGTGTGVFMPYLLDKIGTDGSLICLDYAEEMIKEAKAKKHAGNISFICTDIVTTGLPENFCDAVVCYSVFPHFDHPFRALQEIARVLKPGGWLYVCHTSSRQTINEIHHKIPEVCDHVLPENDDFRRMLIQAGFVDISIEDGAEDYLVKAKKI